MIRDDLVSHENVATPDYRARVIEWWRLMEITHDPRPNVPVEGDAASAVPPDTVKELVALAKADKREDFDFLAGAVGVPAARQDALWTGTRARLNKPVEEPEPPRYPLVAEFERLISPYYEMNGFEPWR